jgi:hypothetical protein
MISPAAMFIEIAANSLKEVPELLAHAQRKELYSFGDVRAKRIGATELNTDFILGYELGLATMRVLLKGNQAAAQAGVDL